MELESVLSLFDLYWFNLEIFKKQPKPTSSSNPNPKIEENSAEIEKDSSQLEIIQLGSQSDYLSDNSDCFSPVSVLPPTLFLTDPKKAESKKVEGKRREKRRRRIRSRKGLCKSLSQLEYEELKGFMDLGFEFSEDDFNSSLVEIIPGLQKLARNRDSESQEKWKKSRSRPYLSEAWEVVKKMDPLMNWKLPPIDMSNEIDIKQSLKCWAHTVASTVIKA